METNSKPSNITAIKEFFKDSRLLTMAELRELSLSDREELGRLCREELEKQGKLFS